MNTKLINLPQSYFRITYKNGSFTALYTYNNRKMMVSGNAARVTSVLESKLGLGWQRNFIKQGAL
ncbi:hypothetical protein [Vibrio crassostreae]|uniref:hypothetical protein n=1 Tax=Vibrio crassostreae TaxID=246167 RepID=UPI001B310F5C|nr:hypothetical protein [Vibrio crassostreae]